MKVIYLGKLVIVAATLIILLSACGGSGGSSGTTTTSSSYGEIYPESFTIGGLPNEENIGNYKVRVLNLNREFSFFRPANPELKKLPLVIDFHGAGGYVAPTFDFDKWVLLARSEKFFLLKPQAVRDHINNYTYWNVGFDVGRNDVLFVERILDEIIKQQEIDLDRIYVTGMSSGGHMALFTAQALQNRIAAVAPISGSIATSNLAAYSFSKPMPICNINGDSDSVVSVLGGDWYLAWNDILSLWIKNNKAEPIPSITRLPNVNETDGTTVTKYEYRGSTRAADIDDYRVNGGGHSIPGIEPEANQDINAYEVIWAFFKNHQLSDPY